MCGLPVAILEFVVYRDPTGCLIAFYFSPFEVRDDSNPSGDGLSHLNWIKLGGAATALMEHAGEENPNVEPSVRSARLWLSWSTPDGNPSVEPPSVRLARLRLSWSTPGGNPSVEPPSARLVRLWLSWSRPGGTPSVELR